MTGDSDDLASLLAHVDEVAKPKRGDLLHGLILAQDNDGLIIDLGLKRDGIVPCADLEKLPPDEPLPQVGENIAVMVIDPLDRDGNLLVSIAQAMESDDWLRAHRLMENDAIIELEPCGFNKGGLIVPFGRLRGFVPASHLSDLPRGLPESRREEHLNRFVGRKLPFKVIEVDPRRRRLVLSERKAVRQWRQERKSEMIGQLNVGDIRKGVVTSLREFGVFVDIGGADGLIHISELAWKRVDDPGNILAVGQEVDTQVIRLDEKSNRIGLSLKRLLPNPWEAAVGRYTEGQELGGTISHVGASGAYVLIEDSLEGLLRNQDISVALVPGSHVQVRVVSFEPERERLDLEIIMDYPGNIPDKVSQSSNGEADRKVEGGE